MVRSNAEFYKYQFDRSLNRMTNEMYLVEVLSVDYERRVLTLPDMKDNLIYNEVNIFPANTSSSESIDINMPEQGAMGIACNYDLQGGFKFPMIVSWVHIQALWGQDAIANRTLSGDRVQGYSDRRRMSYRKAMPGQKTSSYTGGYAEKVDTAWDRQGADMSRDKVDIDKRQWTQIAGRRVAY